jgi:hypothetical protein
MTSNRDRLSGFEERLLTELKSVVAHRKTERSAMAPARAPIWRRLRVVSVASAGALAIGAAVGLPLVGGETTAPPASAAYEVTTNEDGTVTVTVYRFSDAEGLERQLEEHGVPADVAFTPVGERCQTGRYGPAPTRHLVSVDTDAKDWTFTVRPSDLAEDETLVITRVRGEAGEPEVRLGEFEEMKPVPTDLPEECLVEQEPIDPAKQSGHAGNLTELSSPSG